MTRTRLRGLEIAGIQMGIEVPASDDWEWPDGPVEEYVCLPRKPEVHIGIRVSDFSSADLGGECYGLGAWTFEVAPHVGGWLLGLSRRGIREQLATFDQDFRSGEILVSRDAAKHRRFPLRSPFDEWIVLHRTVARGGLCLHAGVGAVDGPFRIRLDADSRTKTSKNRWASHRMALQGRDTVMVRDAGAGLRRFSTPWSDSADSLPGRSAPVCEFVVKETTMRPYQETLDPDEAADLLVTHAVIPLCDESLMDHVLRNARNIAGQTRVVRCGELEERLAPIAWQSLHLQHVSALSNPSV